MGMGANRIKNYSNFEPRSVIIILIDAHFCLSFLVYTIVMSFLITLLFGQPTLNTHCNNAFKILVFLIDASQISQDNQEVYFLARKDT